MITLIYTIIMKNFFQTIEYLISKETNIIETGSSFEAYGIGMYVCIFIDIILFLYLILMLILRLIKTIYQIKKLKENH